MRIAHRFGVLAVVEVFRDGVHRTGAIERNDGDEILKCRRLHVHEQAFESRRLHLEHALAVARRQHGIDPLFVKRDVRHRKGGVFLLNFLFGSGDHGQVAQPQKVHFEDAQFFQIVHGILRRHRVAVETQRHKIAHGARRDHNARRMGGRVARHALKPLGKRQHLGNTLVLLGGVAQLL